MLKEMLKIDGPRGSSFAETPNSTQQQQQQRRRPSKKLGTPSLNPSTEAVQSVRIVLSVGLHLTSGTCLS